MNKPLRIVLALLSWLACLLTATSHAQQRPAFHIESLNPAFEIEADPQTGMIIATNDVSVTFSNVVLTANGIVLNPQSGEVTAVGAVRIQRGEALWTGDQAQYNFDTERFRAEHFRAGVAPFYVSGERAGTSETTNQVYTTTGAFLTTDDVARPGYRIRARRLTIVPGRYVEAENATVYFGQVPVFYLPHFRKSLTDPPAFVLIPGYRSVYGPYVLGAYNWNWGTNLSGTVHLDYRERRGVGTGLDLDYDLGKLGQGRLGSYYVHDEDPQAQADAYTNLTIAPDRYRINWSHSVTLRTNLTAKAVVRKQSDPLVTHDFFESEYRRDPQPSSFIEASQLWPNFSLDVLARPQLNDFFETVERLPDLKLTAVRQQLGVSPFYYEGENSIGWYRHSFANGISNDFSAWRGDSFHQILLPQTFFGWLTITPRAGGRFTHYGEADGHGTTTTEEDRWVFNAGAEASAKASRLWPGVRNKFWEVDGLRHIVQPSVNYAYVPEPNVRPHQLPQFDTEWPSLRLLPIMFPDYNAIDAIDSQNVLRFALHNKLQTKRKVGVENVVNWALFTDWRLHPREGQNTFADVFSDMDFKPRTWLTLNSEVRYSINDGRFNLAFNTATLEPNDVWSLSLGHRYVRDDPLFGPGNNLIVTSLYYRFNENWGARISHQFEARDGTMEEQYYTIYRDLRSWTTALTFRVRDNRSGPTDFTVALTFSLKAFPRFGLGSDKNTPSLLLGG